MLLEVYDRVGIFAPQYYGTIQYYATMARYAHAIVDLDLRYDKRFKSVHRCQIIDTRGPLTLTVPVSKPKSGGSVTHRTPQPPWSGGSATCRTSQQPRSGGSVTCRTSTEPHPLLWSDLTVSSQAGWWADHRVSLESAYGRTPFFEFYIDRFLPYLRDINIPITELDRAIDTTIRTILGLETQVTYRHDMRQVIDPPLQDCRDMRQVTDPQLQGCRDMRQVTDPQLQGCRDM
ncbi:MAG: WbqC family protein, partial [Bacteroidales bacterium]|nr:WbqC family protein [Bacteroidales bacterium]